MTDFKSKSPRRPGATLSRTAVAFRCGLLMVALAACRQSGPATRDESHPPPSLSPPRSKGCADVPTAATLKTLLQNAPAQNGDAGGLNHGKAMWAAVTNRDGELCALAVSTDDAAATWPGSRGHRDREGGHSERVQLRHRTDVDGTPLHAQPAWTLAVGRGQRQSVQSACAGSARRPRAQGSARSAAARSPSVAGLACTRARRASAGLGSAAIPRAPIMRSPSASARPVASRRLTSRPTTSSTPRSTARRRSRMRCAPIRSATERSSAMKLRLIVTDRCAEPALTDAPSGYAWLTRSLVVGTMLMAAGCGSPHRQRFRSSRPDRSRAHWRATIPPSCRMTTGSGSCQRRTMRRPASAA